MNQPVCVVGTGHGGSAVAASLALHGYEVNLLKFGHEMHIDHFSQLTETRQLCLSGILGDDVVELKSVTRDVSAAIAQSDIILVLYVANFHQRVAEEIAPHLTDRHAVYLCPGYLGSVLVRRQLERIGNRAEPLLIEGETLPFTSRILEPGHVTITSQNVRQPIAALPSSRIEEALDLIEQLLGRAVKRDSLIEVALHNPNLIIHTVGTLMNISKVEDERKNFAMYRDGFSPSVWKIVEALDAEKMAVLKSLRFAPRTYFEEFMLRTFGDNADLDPMAGFMHYAGEAPNGPFTLENRYLTEDVPMGLGLLSSLGEHLSIKTPVADLLISLSSIVIGRDVRRMSRSVETLGFVDLSSMLQYLQ